MEDDANKRRAIAKFAKDNQEKNDEARKKIIEIKGEDYVYCSAKNEIRRIDQREGYEVALLVGCFVLGKFVWCC